MILNQHGINAQSSGVTPDEVIIGGRVYRTVTIGDRIWLAENLQYEWPGLDVSEPDNPLTGTVTDPAAWFYNDDVTYALDESKPCGFLYNGAAFEYLANHPELLPDGWRLPNYADQLDLRVTQANSNAAHLKVIDGTFNGWPTSWNGDDSLGFGLVPSGYRTSTGSFVQIDTNSRLRINYKVNGNYTYLAFDTTNTVSYVENPYYDAAVPIRLVRDV